MQNKLQPLLSICIPTYNRAEYLGNCLDSIISQEGFNEDAIEIIISDNDSKDDTTALVKGYQKQYTNIKYFRNDENMGMVKNLTMIVNYAQGKYSWILSDDDALFDNVLNKILAYLENLSCSVLVLNYADFDHGLKRSLVGNVMQLEADLNLLNKNEFTNCIIQKWDQLVGGTFLYVSNKIFRTDIFQASFIKEEILQSKIKDEYKYEFPFSMILFSELMENGTYIVSQRMVKLRTENLSWDISMSYYYQHHLCKFFYKHTTSHLLKIHLLKIIPRNLFYFYATIITKRIGLYEWCAHIWRNRHKKNEIVKER